MRVTLLPVGVEASSGESPVPPRKRSGPVRSALLKALRERRKVEGWTPALEVSAQVALRFADQVDQLEGVAMVRAAEQLDELMVRLGLAPAPRAGVNPSDGDGGSRTPDERERLHVVMDGPPQVGDSAHG